MARGSKVWSFGGSFSRFLGPPCCEPIRPLGGAGAGPLAMALTLKPPSVPVGSRVARSAEAPLPRPPGMLLACSSGLEPWELRAPGFSCLCGLTCLWVSRPSFQSHHGEGPARSLAFSQDCLVGMEAARLGTAHTLPYQPVQEQNSGQDRPAWLLSRARTQAGVPWGIVSFQV